MPAALTSKPNHHRHSAGFSWRERWAACLQIVLEPSLVRAGSGTLARSVALLSDAFGLPTAASLGWVDTGTGLRNQARFLACGDEFLTQTRQRRGPLTLMVLDFEDLLEAHSIYGSEVSSALRKHLVLKLLALAGRRGLLARTGKVQFSLLLPGRSRGKVAQAMQRVLGSPARIEFDVGREEIVLVPDVVLANVAGSDSPMALLHRELCDQLLQRRSDENRRRHMLQRERERHSRPMGLAPQQLAASFPVPLVTR